MTEARPDWISRAWGAGSTVCSVAACCRSVRYSGPILGNACSGRTPYRGSRVRDSRGQGNELDLVAWNLGEAPCLPITLGLLDTLLAAGYEVPLDMPLAQMLTTDDRDS